MRLENEEEMSESNRPERVVWEEVIFSVTATQRCSLPDIMACSGERVCVLGGFFQSGQIMEINFVYLTSLPACLHDTFTHKSRWYQLLLSYMAIYAQ